MKPLPVRVIAVPISSEGSPGRRLQNAANKNNGPFNNIQENSCETQALFFGYALGMVVGGCFRLASVNVNRLGVYSSDSKNEELFKAIKEYHSDITLLQEVGVNWSTRSRANSWRTRTDTYLDKLCTQTKCSFNQHDLVPTPSQLDGTGVLRYGKMAFQSLYLLELNIHTIFNNTMTTIL